MKILFIFCAVALLAACNNDDKGVYVKMPDHAIRDSIKDPATEQPPSEAIPGDMKIGQDSVIRPRENSVQPNPGTADDTTHP